MARILLTTLGAFGDLHPFVALAHAMAAAFVGMPQVLVPFAPDQPDNARRIARLGAGIELPYRKLTVAKLTAALRRVTQDASFAAVASRMRSAFGPERFAVNVQRVVRSVLRENEIAAGGARHGS